MGTVYLVGAGPGDPELITIKGVELLKNCDVVIYDRLASFQLLEYVRKDCIKIYVGKKAGNHSKTQDEINRIIVENALKYEKILRLKGGDPFVFGRGGEEIEELLKHDIPYEVIPGVTSAISVPESVGIPVTHRGASQSFHVITGHTKYMENQLTDNYETLAKLEGTLVFLMGLSNINKIIQNLINYGKDKSTPVAVISNGTMYNEKVVRGTLEDIVLKVSSENIVSPAIIVIGETARYTFAKKSIQPLAGLKVGITGTKTLRDKMEKGLSQFGAIVYSMCDMHIEETSEIEVLKRELFKLDKYQWVLFTSQNSIKIFFDKIDELQIDRRRLNCIKFAVIGSGTKDALKNYGYYADFIPSKFTTLNLANEFSSVINEEETVLIPRALQGSKDIIEIFVDKKVRFKEICIYDVKGKLTENSEYISEMDCLAFVSKSGVEAFFEGIKKEDIRLLDNIKIACIGDITVDAVKRAKMNADIIASVYNTEGLIEAICNFKWKNI